MARALCARFAQRASNAWYAMCSIYSHEEGKRGKKEAMDLVLVFQVILVAAVVAVAVILVGGGKQRRDPGKDAA